jgi:hypothetical protein
MRCDPLGYRYWKFLAVHRITIHLNPDIEYGIPFTLPNPHALGIGIEFNLD